MSKLLKCKIDVKKINKDLLFVGNKGTWLDIDIWINDKEDQYGSDVSIQQSTKKDEPKIYIGNGKTWKPKESNSLPDKQGEYQKSGSMSDVEELGKTIDENNLPF